MTRLFAVLAATTLLAACNAAEGDGNTALAEANASGNAASNAVANAVAASDATPLQKEQALALMEERHENYEKIGKSMRAAKQGLDRNDLPAVRTAAATINELAPRAAEWFPAGTGPDVGKTEALAAIWEQPEFFSQRMAAFRADAAAFNQAAQGNDVAAIKAAHAKLGATCKACHDTFREEH